MAAELQFRSAVGWTFRIPALLVAVVLVASQAKGLNLVSLVSVGLSLAFVVWLYRSTVYTVTDQGLRVRSGPLNRWVDGHLIERVRPTRTILSAPALSLDRLEVSGQFGSIVVSPADQTGFVRALQRVVPDLVVEGTLRAPRAGDARRPPPARP